jgi:NAD(P)-dependent dehydrogenase (short-subunit alcohol dehydrogenase family)
MQLNYFGCLRVTMGLLPGMVAKKKGHVVNISSIGVLTNAPRFSAYVASKAALDAWTRCASSEFADQGISFTTINMPLVRTPMIAPTGLYNNVPTLSPEEAADMVAQACIFKPVRIATRLGITGQVLHAAVAARGPDRHEHQFPHVPGFQRRQGGQAGRQACQAAVVGRGNGHAADDARDPFLTELLPHRWQSNPD